MKHLLSIVILCSTVAAAAQAEFRGLFDRVDGVAASVRESDDLRLRGLRLQQKGREVGGIERMAHSTHHLAAAGHDDAPDSRPVVAAG